MAKHDLSKIKVNASVVDPLGGSEVRQEVDPAAEALRLRYYDPVTAQPISFDHLERRIRKNADRMNRLSVEMMFDLYFAHANWSGFYDRTDSFSSWLERTVDVSRSYAYDIIKVVRTMIHYVHHQASGADPLPIEEIGRRIEAVGLKKMKLISQVKDQGLQYTFLSRVLSGESLADQDIIERNRELLQRGAPRGSAGVSDVPVPRERVREVITSLEAALKNPAERERALGAREVVIALFGGTDLEQEIRKTLED
ncbi:hypothetical protein [Alkalispirochaeta alkalica]|uniref:hypothetical protein n=1 Tax=Alkalispirochaeta alkalica TaxID=46356 RepID=UPI00035D6363|nr:hypothetical protein [Alkalispirochaeta alkalica]